METPTRHRPDLEEDCRFYQDKIREAKEVEPRGLKKPGKNSPESTIT
jgi:hypothetical protein